MAVEVSTNPSFTAATAQVSLPSAGRTWALMSISPDGQRFAFLVPMPPERNEVTLAPDILTQYTGTYVNAGGKREGW